METIYEDEGPIVYARVAPRVAELPARYTAPLPTTRALWGRPYHPAYPPPWFIEARLRAGDVDMLRRVEEAIHARGADVSWLRWGPAQAIGCASANEVVWQWTRELFRSRSRWAGETAAWAALVTGIASNVWRAGAAGPDAELVPLLLEEGVPDEAVAAFFSHRAARSGGEGEKGIWRDRVHGVLVRAAEQPWSGMFNDAAWAVAGMDRARAVSVLSAIVPQMPPGDPRRETLVRVLRSMSDPAAESAVAQEPIEELWSPSTVDVIDANEAVRLHARGAGEVLRARPDALVEVVVALECMVNDSAVLDFDRRRALLQLSDLAHDEAVTLAEQTEDPALEPIASALRRFARAGDLERYLFEAGLLGVESHVPAPRLFASAPEVPAHAWNVLDLLPDATTAFDGKTGAFPNQHDRILRDLAKLTGKGPLAELVFEEIPPEGHGRDDDGESAESESLPEVYRLRAYGDGKVWEVLAEASGWLDVVAMIALCNTVSCDLGLITRFVELPGTEPMHYVLAADEAAILRAVADGVLAPVA